MEDFVSDVLSKINIDSAVYFKYCFYAPWGMGIPKGNKAQFHMVVKGRCWLLRPNKNPLPVSQGDVIVFPHGGAHELKSDFEVESMPGGEVVNCIVNGEEPFQGSEDNCTLICGHFALDHDIRHPIIQNLPDCLIINGESYGRFDLLRNIAENLIEELNEQKPGYQLVTLRLADILLISVIRHYYLKNDRQINFLKDPIIYEALNIMHANLAVNWNIEKIIKELGISRTLFIEKFKKTMGETPIKYLSRWKLNEARSYLKSSSEPIHQIGYAVGYQSEAAFIRAFKKEFAISPHKFRLVTTDE
ncbi:AraC family transcriptional regulator [Fulvivirgaceae bacterium BMA12]|uniref:AraC family transcriptional regulator n=1 Tax=Agaribacillus aureus TaxID=3051825 RepID=A0ABT8L239_9BACT|nr:AraC family transcriptional regulator [Fulvivirgaceae bacterium BMA12]